MNIYFVALDFHTKISSCERVQMVHLVLEIGWLMKCVNCFVYCVILYFSHLNIRYNSVEDKIDDHPKNAISQFISDNLNI